MTARYFTMVADELLPELRGPRMPNGLRLIREVHQPTEWPGNTIVEFEDDDAPAHMNGRNVSFQIGAEYNDDGEVGRTFVMSRHIVKRW